MIANHGMDVIPFDFASDKFYLGSVLEYNPPFNVS
jgi:hypothetical protein